MNAAQYDFLCGSLFLRGSPGGEVRLTWKPVPSAHVLVTADQWKPVIPTFRLLAPSIPLQQGMDPAVMARLQEKEQAFLGFRAELPATLATAVEPFTCYQWPLMVLLNQSPVAGDLVHANPVLAFAVANNAEFLSGSSSEVAASRANRFSRQKQREIAGALGFPDTEAVARLFKKIPVPIVYPGLLRKLRQCVAIPEVMKMFGHAPTINTGMIFVASHPDLAALVTPKLMQELARDQDETMGAPTADLLAEILSFASAMHKKTQLRPFASRRKVQECHAQLSHEHQDFETIVARQKELEAKQRLLVSNHTYKGRLPLFAAEQLARLQAEYRRLDARRPDRLPRPAPRPAPAPAAIDISKLAIVKFPAPPIPGTDTIIPLTSFSDFQEEGTNQCNCLGNNYSYLTHVLRGDIYVYRVLAPERHTLCIIKRDTHWQIAELRQARNQPATSTADAAVRNWLSANQISL